MNQSHCDKKRRAGKASAKGMALLLAFAVCGCSAANGSASSSTVSTSVQSSTSSKTALENSQKKDSPVFAESFASYDENGQITITDDLNRTVTFHKPERVAVLIGSFADEFVSAGGKEQIVAAAHDTFTSFDLGLEDVTDLGDVKSINQESLLAAKPDLVIASGKNDSQKDMLEVLENAGIPVLYFDVSSFDDYLSTLKRMSEITGDQKAYEDNGLAQQEEIEAIAKTPREETLRVLALRETGKGVSALGSSNSVLGEMLADLQAENLAGDKGLKTLSMEEIQVQNPDIILYVAQGKNEEQAREMADRLFSQDAWKNLDAVQNGKVYVLDQKRYNLKPNGKWAQSLKELETLLYGEE